MDPGQYVALKYRKHSTTPPLNKAKTIEFQSILSNGHPEILRTWVTPSTTTSKTLYEKLDPSKKEIRLLRVLPAAPSAEDEKIKCIIYKCSADEVLDQYLAVSYVWGDPNIREVILVNGEEVSVTKNLATFLRHWQLLTHQGDPITYHGITPTVTEEGQPTPESWTFHFMLDLWVDALCINQNDIHERNIQVAGMRDRYLDSIRTISWLGPGTESSSKAISSLHEIYVFIKSNKAACGVLVAISQHRPDLIMPPVWDGICDFFRNPYWSRRWILQELVLPNEVVLCCGDDLLSFDVVSDLIRWLEKLASFSLEDQVYVSLIRDKERGPLDRYSNLTLLASGQWIRLNELHHVQLVHHKHAQLFETPYSHRDHVKNWHDWLYHSGSEVNASDPRDHIFGSLAMAGRHPGIEVDYRKSVEEVYLEYAKLYAKTFDRLSFLRAAGHNQGFGYASVKDKHPHHIFVPSWVPNWDALSMRLDINYLMFPPKQPNTWRADGRPPEDFGRKWRFDGRVLRAHGVYIGTISSSHHLVRPLDVETREQDDVLLDFCRDAVERNPEISEQLLELAFAGGTIRHDRESVDSEYNRALKYAELKLWAARNPRVSEIFSHIKFHPFEQLMGSVCCLVYDKSEEYSRVMNDRHVYIENYNVIRTNNGKVGWGPHHAQPGDRVMILFGCETPVVLRHVDNHFIHLGPAFIPSVTDGSHIKWLKGLANKNELIESIDIM